MKTLRRNKTRPARPTRARPGRNFDHRWWGEPDPRSEADATSSYWSDTRRPLPCLAFILPFLVAYEAGVTRLGATASAEPRAGADAWIRRGLASIGLTDRWLVPLGLALILLAWQAFTSGRRWRFHPGLILGMLVESLVLGLTLIGLGRLVALGFSRLEAAHAPVLAVSLPASLIPLVGFLGAGLYEETLFRLTLIPTFHYLLRLLQAPALLSRTAAVTGSSLLFALAHHAGLPGEPFTWYAFLFRWSAGVFFAWTFLARGFGIAVGTHIAYDLMVGWGA